MKLRIVISRAAAAVIVTVAPYCLGQQSADSVQAKDLLDTAVAQFQKEGPARAFCAFNDSAGRFHQGPLYVFAINMDGVYFAHSAAPTLVGTSLRDTRDAGGQPIGKNIMELVMSQGEGTLDYLWLNYSTNKVEKKHSFVKRVDDFVLGVGYYTR